MDDDCLAYLKHNWCQNLKLVPCIRLQREKYEGLGDLLQGVPGPSVNIFDRFAQMLRE